MLGFHGTDEDTVKTILNDPKKHLDESANGYDWLGNGIYFWENDPERALAFCKERFKFKKISDKKPAVIGAVIDLGLCLNLFDQPALIELKEAYTEFSLDMAATGTLMPVNEGSTQDRLYRYLDRAVIQHLHRLRLESAVTPAYETVRSGFHEGKEVYQGSGFKTKNHIQIAVREKSCIKGYFLPRKADGKWDISELV